MPKNRNVGANQRASRTLGLLLGALLLFAGATSAAEEPELLRATEAFTYTTEAGTDSVVVNWKVAPSYYLYKSRMSFASNTDGITLGEPKMRKGKIKNDEYFGVQETYRGDLRVEIPYTGTARTLDLKIKSQGCADAGLCYPPQTWTASLTLPAAAAASSDGGLLDMLAANADSTNIGGPLSPEQAFRFDAIMEDDYTLLLRWDIEPDYYIYVDKLGLTVESNLIQLGSINWPTGKMKDDPEFGRVEVYESPTEIRIPVSRASRDAGSLNITASYQGCAEVFGICYPPGERNVLVAVDAASTGGQSASSAGASNTNSGDDSLQVSEQDKLAQLIKSGSLPLVIATFFGFGLLLAFTPCVLPMVPILSGIIAGQQGKPSARRSFMLSLVYVLAMALTYTIAGVIVAMLGQNVQAMFQNPYVLIGFSLVFVALALAMFDVWQFQVPVALQNKLNSAGSGGGYAGVAIMGTLSALIVGPCVAAPLVAVLIFIGQSGDAVRGGITLFALSMGMGAPLLVYGATAGQLMLKAGGWMEVVKRLFGIMLLGVAIWLLARILSPRTILALWALLALCAAWAFGLFTKNNLLIFRAAAVASLVYGLAMGASAFMGGTDPLNLTRGTPFGEQELHLDYRKVASVKELQRVVAENAANGKTTMLDFYADWCVECIKMEKEAFSDQAVHDALADTVVLQADVTKNDDNDQALLKYFGIYGPPTIAFFDKQGNERRNFRVVGYMNADEFADHAARAVAD
ncbi:MAG: protein-disulfide reductase DsbD [Gammaproteobacteria bacterium]